VGSVAGIGIDLAEIGRIRLAIDRTCGRFVSRVLSPHELDEVNARALSGDALAVYVAGRFAAKEAVGKAIGIGVGKLGWANVSVVAAAGGRPVCSLHGPALAVAREAGVCRVLISVTHTGSAAAAMAVAVRPAGGDGLASTHIR
jgi:holo-[acyl-carrier protein] synthase